MPVDSSGRSSIGDLVRSAVGDFQKTTPEDVIHLGYVDATSLNEVATPPVVIGGNVVFACYIDDPNTPFFIRLKFISIGEFVLTRISGPGAGNNADYTTDSTDTAAAAAGLAAACAARADSFFQRVAWTSEGSVLHGAGQDAGSDLSFSYAGGGSVDQRRAFAGDTLPAFLTVSADLSSVVSVKKIPWGSTPFLGLDYNQYGIDGTTLVVSAGSFGFLEFSGANSLRRVATQFAPTMILLEGANYVYVGSTRIKRIAKADGASVLQAVYTGITEIASVASDGTYYYIAAREGSGLLLLKVDSNFDVVQCYEYNIQGGSTYRHGAAAAEPGDGPHIQVINDTVVMYASPVNATSFDPIWWGVQASDISVVKWVRTSRAQEDFATIGINDAATTYTIAFGAQNVSVAGNAAGPSNTASDLRDACDASVASNFANRTWTVNGTEVKGVWAFPGVDNANITSSVTGGTGTISHSTTEFRPTYYPRGSFVSGNDVYFGGRRKINATTFALAARKIAAATGVEAWTITASGTPAGDNTFSGVFVSGSEIYHSGIYRDTPSRFGLQDIVVAHLPNFPDGLNDQEQTPITSLVDRTSTIGKTTAVQNDLVEENLLINDGSIAHGTLDHHTF